MYIPKYISNTGRYIALIFWPLNTLAIWSLASLTCLWNNEKGEKDAGDADTGDANEDGGEPIVGVQQVEHLGGDKSEEPKRAVVQASHCFLGKVQRLVSQSWKLLYLEPALLGERAHWAGWTASVQNRTGRSPEREREWGRPGCCCSEFGWGENCQRWKCQGGRRPRKWDDQHRNPNTNNKDHLAGQLTRGDPEDGSKDDCS